MWCGFIIFHSINNQTVEMLWKSTIASIDHITMFRLDSIRVIQILIGFEDLIPFFINK